MRFRLAFSSTHDCHADSAFATHCIIHRDTRRSTIDRDRTTNFVCSDHPTSADDSAMCCIRISTRPTNTRCPFSSDKAMRRSYHLLHLLLLTTTEPPLQQGDR